MSLNPKDLAGKAKPQMGLIPHAALVEVARVMEVGAAKYGAYNWRDKPIGYMAYLNAAERHRGSFQDGEDQDPETRRSHLAHLAATALILLDAIVTGNAVDDRPKKNPAYVEPAPTPPVLKPGISVSWSSGLEERVAAGLTTDIPVCNCVGCVEIRAIKARRSLAEQPADSGSQNSTGTGHPTAPKL